MSYIDQLVEKSKKEREKKKNTVRTYVVDNDGRTATEIGVYAGEKPKAKKIGSYTGEKPEATKADSRTNPGSNKAAGENGKKSGSGLYIDQLVERANAERQKKGYTITTYDGKTGQKIGSEHRDYDEATRHALENVAADLAEQEVREPTLWDLTGRSVARGYNQSRLGEETWAAMHGYENDVAKYEEKLAQDKYQFEADKWWQKALSGAAEQLGQMARQYTDPEALAYGTTAAALAGAAGQAGPQVLAPEEVITMPAGFVAGMAYGGSLNSMEIEGGNAYREMLEAGVSEDTARKFAEAVGAGNALIEVFQLDELVDAYKVLDKSGADTSIKKRIFDELVKRSVNVAKETGEELLQEGVTIGGTQMASKKDTGEYAYTGEEVLDRLGDTAVSSFLTFGTLNAPATGRNVYNIVQNERQMDKVGGEYQVAAEDLVNEGLSFAPDTSAYKAAQTLKAKLDAGEAVSNRELANLAAANDRAIQNDTPTETNNTPTARSNTPTVAENTTVERTTEEALMEAAKRATGVKDAQNTPYNVLSNRMAGESGVRNVTNEVDATRKKIEQKASQPKYGTHGMQAFSEIVENSTENYDKVRTQFERAYQAGLVELPRNSVSLVNEVQEKAYQAGRQDYILSLADSQRKGATVWGKEGGLVQNSESQKLDKGVQTQLDRWGRATGTKIIVDSRLVGTRQNGYYSDGEIHLSPDADKPLMIVARHEITHHLQVAAPEAYTAFRNYAIQKMNEGTPYGGVTISEDMRGRYLEASDGDVDLSTEEAMDEVAAHFAEKLLSDEKAMDDFVREVSNSKDTRTWAQKFFDAVHDFVEKVKKAFGKGKKADQAVLDEYGITVEQFEKAEKLWQDAIRAAGDRREQTTKNATPKDGADVKYLLKKVNGKNVVWIDNADLTNKQLNDHKAIAEYIAHHIGEVYTIIESGQKVYIGKELPSEYTQSKYTSYLRQRSPQTLKAKNKAVSDLGLLIETATNRRWERTKHAHSKDAEYGMYRYDSSFAFPVKNADGSLASIKAYDVELLIRNSSDRKKYLYDIVGIKKNTTDALDLLKRETRKGDRVVAAHGGVSTDNVPQQDNSVKHSTDLSDMAIATGEDTQHNKKYSLKDSEGNNMTEAQQEYFKNSKARDKDGNLMVFYHGTLGGGFTQFDPEFSADGRSLFFTSSLANAASYSGVYDIHVPGSEGGKPTNYAVYLNLTNPLIIHAEDANYDYIKFLTPEMKEMEERATELEQFGYSLDQNDPRRTDAFADADILRDALDDMDPWYGDRKETRQVAEWAQKQGYDGVIFYDLIDYAGELEVEGGSATVAVAFSAEQVKSVENKDPTPDPDIRFSLKSPREETKNLIALHNLTADKLLKSLKLGGFPMPSIAVTKADIPHTNFGDITLVMNKSTVDPKASRKNTVYSADAWTPTFPKVEYEVNRDVERAFFDKAYKAAGAIPEEYIRTVHNMAGQLEYYLNTYETEESVKERLVKEYAFKALYLADKGEKVESKTRENRIEKAKNDMLEAVLKVFDEDIETLRKTSFNELHSKYAETVKQVLIEHGRTEEAAEKMVAKKGGLVGGFDKLIGRVIRYAEEPTVTVETVTDTKGIEQDINSRIDPKAYDKWLSNMLSGLVKDSGIYNGKDIFTPSGNRRTFKQTHYPVTLDNIAKAMAAQNGGSTKNVMGFVGVKSLRAGTAERFKSIADMHKREGRLKHLSEEENTAIIDALDKRLVDVIDRIYESSTRKNERERWMMLDSIGNILMEVTEQPKYTVDSISKVFDQYGYKLGNQLAMDIRDLLFDVSEMPVNLFEAKPERAVRFDEVLAAVVPNTAPAELRNGLEQAGVRVMEYQEGNDADRLAKVNSVDDARFSLKEHGNLQRENTKLKEVDQTLREQFKTTKFAKVDKKALDKFTKELLKDYSSGADINDTRNALDGLYTYIANGENGESAVWDVAYEKAYDTAVGILSEVGMMNDDLYQQYKSLRDSLRKTGMTISETDRASLGSYGGYDEFRRANFGRIKLVNNGVPVDTAYEELAGVYPELFDAYEYTHPADQLLHIAEVLDSLQPYQVNPYERNMREAATWLANDIMERFFELPQAKPTFADKAERKMTQQIIKDHKKLERLREQKNERIKEIIQDNREKVKKAQTKERQKRLEAVKETKEHYQAKEKRMSESRKATVLRTRIQRHAADLSKKLLHPTDKHHIPEDMRVNVAALLENINLESQYTLDEMGKRHKGGEGEPVGRTKAFRALRKQYEDILNDKAPAGGMVVDPDAVEILTNAYDIGDTRIADMNVQELSALWSAIRLVEQTVNSANKVLSKAKFQETSDWANSINDETQSRRAMKGKGIEEVRLNLENPYTYFSHYGEAGHEIFRMLRDAQDHQQEMVQNVQAEVAKIVDPKTVKKLEETAHVFTTERGDKLTLTTAHMMEIHLLMKREQARDHLLKGGIIQPEVESKKIVRGSDAILLTYGDLGKIIGKLTPAQLDIAEKLQKLTSTTLADYGNEASMKAYGYKKFTGTDYWPIKSAREGIHSNIEKGAGNTRSIKNIGLAKNVVPHASNQLDIRGVFETFAGHAADMTDYAAWLCPMEDANRLYNFDFRDDEGFKTGKTMKGLLDKVGGKGAQDYWHNLMEDIQNGLNPPSDTWFAKAINKVVGNVKGASVGANIRVIAQQPTAILRAAVVLSPADMAKGLMQTGGWEAALEHSAIAQRKDMGGFDISSPMQIGEILFDKRTKVRKFNDFMMSGAGAADAFAWGRVWRACEANIKRTRPNLKVGSDTYYEAVDALFTEVVDQSQVVDGVLQRSQVMRSGNAVIKQATSFMGEPTMALNMVLRAFDGWRNESDPQKRTAAKKMFSRTIVVLVATNAVNALAQSLVDAWRDDEDDEKYWERVWKQFVGLDGSEESAWEKAVAVVLSGNLGSSLNPMTYVPIAKDVVSIFSGYDVARMDAAVLEDVINAFRTFFKSMTKKGSKTKVYGVKELAHNIFRACGISATNILRDVWGVVRSIAVETDSVELLYEMEKIIYKSGHEDNKNRFTDILYKAYVQGSESYERIYNDMMKNGLDPEGVADRMEENMMKAQGVTKTDDLEHRYLAPDPQRDFDAQMQALQSNRLWDKATEEQRKDLETDVYDLIVQNKPGEKLREDIDEGADYGLSETEYLLYNLALSMVDQPNGSGKLGGSPTLSEKAAAIEEVGTLSDGDIAYLWDTEEGFEAFAEGIDMETYARFKVFDSATYADKDENGKSISGSKKKKVRKWLNDNEVGQDAYDYFMYEVKGYKK